MKHQGTTIEKDVIITDNDKHEVVKKSSSAYEPSEVEVSLSRTHRFQVIANWFVAATTTILGARFLLNLLGANPEAGFAQMVNAISAPLVLPFTALFAEPAVGASVLDTAALVGLVVYPVIGYGIVALLKAMMAPSDPTGRAYQ